MYQGKIFDAHAHIYPAKIAEKAVHNIENFYTLHAECDGTTEMLVDIGKKSNVVGFLVHSTATKREQVSHINDFIISEINAHDCFVGFGTLHYDMEISEIIAETERIKRAGISGIKLHPDCQKFIIDDPKMDNIYSACRDCGLPILMHCGDERYTNSRPERLARAAKKFPDLDFIGAHFGGYQCWDSLNPYLETPNVKFDTSSSLFKLENGKPEELIEKFGKDRFFFGTDYPLFCYESELKRFFSLDLDDDTQADILWNNAAKFLKIE